MKSDIIISEGMKCLRCGSTNLTPANFESTGKVYSRPKDAKLVTVLTTGILINAVLCLDCGHVELVVDAEKARAISKASCTPVLMLMWEFITGVFTPLKLHKDKK